MGRLNDKIAIVTGAGQGIGKAIAGKLTAEGATVVVTDLDEANAKETATAWPGAVAIRTDVTDRQGVQAMVNRVVQQLGRIDVLVNNAGWDKASPFVDSELADWDRAIAVNLYGVLHTCKAVLPVMAGQGSGAVVNLGSDAGLVGSSGEAVYSAAKGGVIAFTKSLAREMARHQVKGVNCVCPGPTDTALFALFAGPKLREALTRAIPFRRLGQPDDVANVVAFLASDEASFVTGQTVSVSGGLTMSLAGRGLRYDPQTRAHRRRLAKEHSVKVSEYEQLRFERRDNGVLLITMNRPDKYNAADEQMHGELARIWAEIFADPETRVAVITGAGKAFSAGGDLDMVRRIAATTIAWPHAPRNERPGLQHRQLREAGHLRDQRRRRRCGHGGGAAGRHLDLCPRRQARRRPRQARCAPATTPRSCGRCCAAWRRPATTCSPAR